MAGKEEIIQTLRDSENIKTSYDDILKITDITTEELDEVLVILENKRIINWDKETNLLSLTKRHTVIEIEQPDIIEVEESIEDNSFQEMLKIAEEEGDEDMINHIKDIINGRV